MMHMNRRSRGERSGLMFSTRESSRSGVRGSLGEMKASGRKLEESTWSERKPVSPMSEWEARLMRSLPMSAMVEKPALAASELGGQGSGSCTMMNLRCPKSWELREIVA